MWGTVREENKDVGHQPRRVETFGQDERPCLNTSYSRVGRPAYPAYFASFVK